MPSPFPGMDPFLEHADVFHDFHERFVPRIADALTPSIRPKYIAKVDANVYVHPTHPPLSPDDLVWAERLLSARKS